MRFFGSRCRDHVAGKGRQCAREIDRQCERALGKQTSISWGCAVALMLCGCGSNAVGDSNSPDSAVGNAVGNSNSADSAVCNAAGNSNSPDSALAVFCDLSDGRRIPAGAAYADVDGCNCCVCRSDGSPVCQAALCLGNGDAGVGPMSCQSDQDCADADHIGPCVFNPGCTSPRGNCMGGNGICPLFAVADMSPISYCGCDGVTYSLQDWKQYPYLPYSHVGACP